jgi:protein-disulfide isomerase
MEAERKRRRGATALAVAAAFAGLLACGRPAEGQEEKAPGKAPARTSAAAPAPGRIVFDLSAIGYDRGDPDAPVFVVEFSDFGCPYCRKFATEIYPSLEKEFIRTGKVRWKYVPFALGIFPNGDLAALAAECAAEQGEPAFWKMHDRLYDGQREWKSTSEPAELFARYARELGFDQARFRSCLDQDRRSARLELSNMTASQLGIRATPTFFVNGIRVEGALPLDLFRRVINDVAAAGITP